MTKKILRWNPLTMTVGDTNKAADELYTLKKYVDRMRANGDGEIDIPALAAHVVGLVDSWETGI